MGLISKYVKATQQMHIEHVCVSVFLRSWGDSDGENMVSAFEEHAVYRCVDRHLNEQYFIQCEKYYNNSVSKAL